MLDEDQVAVLERSCVLLSLKVPMALNCCVFPTTTDGFAGVTWSETRFGVFVVVVLLVPLVPPPQAVSAIRAAKIPARTILILFLPECEAVYANNHVTLQLAHQREWMTCSLDTIWICLRKVQHLAYGRTLVMS